MLDLLTLADVAQRLGCHPKTLRRLLPSLMEHMPSLRARKLGRTILFTEYDYTLTVEAMAWRSQSASAAKSGTRGARSGSVRTSSPSQNSAQDETRKLAHQMLQTAKGGGSRKSTLTVLRGGRAA